MTQMAGGVIPPDDVTIETDAQGKLKIKALSDGLVPTQVVVQTGTVAHGGTIPLPSGYTQAQCQWTVSPNNMTGYGENAAGGDNDQYICVANASRVVSCYTANGAAGQANGTANYVIIGVK